MVSRINGILPCAGSEEPEKCREIMYYLSDQNLKEITIGLIIKYYTKDDIAFVFSAPVKEIIEPCYRYSTLIGDEK